MKESHVIKFSGDIFGVGYWGNMKILKKTRKISNFWNLKVGKILKQQLLIICIEIGIAYG